MVTDTNIVSKQLERNLQTLFPGSRLDVDSIPRSEKIGGFLVWDAFEGQSQRERQATLWDYLRTFPLPLQRQISTIFTVTSGELASMLENDD